MLAHPANPAYRVVRAIGSLWFAAVLLVLLLVGMACATVYESIYSTERALSVYYRSSWSVALLWLIAVNVFAAMVVRFPFNKRQIGFVLTHSSILLVFAGALITRYYAEDGQIPVYEGETTTEFILRDRDTLTLVNRLTREKFAVDLDAPGFGGLRVVERPAIAPLETEGLKIEVERYVPDTEMAERIQNDNPFPRPALEVSVSATGTDPPQWVFPNKRATIASIPVSLRVVATAEELAQLLDTTKTAAAGDKGRVKIEYKGQVVERPVAECEALPVAIGDTGMSFRVLRYMPHASVGSNNKITSISNEPSNPAIEVEVAGPDGTATKLAFARFPDYASMHSGQQLADLKVTHIFEATGAPPPATPLEFVRGPGGDLYLRFMDGRGGLVAKPVSVGQPTDTPWGEQKVTVHQSFDHARLEQSLRPIEEPRKERVPGMLVKVTTADSTETIWLQKYRSTPLTVDGKAYELAYSSKVMPLGFSLTLDSFHVGYYPGTQRPRSFESHITISDPAAGRKMSRIVSMNNPGKYGKYTLFQSSWSERGGRTMSVLSVAHDPGLKVVFAGYILMIGGMLTVFTTRVRQKRQHQHVAVAGGGARGSNGQFRMDLLQTNERCTSGMVDADGGAGVSQQSAKPGRHGKPEREETGARPR